ncbi:MAG: hypothetical protein R2701_05550 [Acidimicrobiales bacterium]
MSLWTPGGERPVGPADEPGAGAPGPSGAPLSAEQEAEAHQIAAEMAAVREQLAQVPAAQVVANHAMGCWELAAIHLSSQPPKFEEAQVAIDGFGALVEVLQGRLGEDESTLNDALAQLRLAFVQLKASFDQPTPDTTEEDGGD